MVEDIKYKKAIYDNCCRLTIKILETVNYHEVFYFEFSFVKNASLNYVTMLLSILKNC